MRNYPTTDKVYFPDSGMRILDPDTEVSIMEHEEVLDINKRYKHITNE